MIDYHQQNTNTITSIGTLELLVKETLMFRPFNLSAAFPRSALTGRTVSGTPSTPVLGPYPTSTFYIACRVGSENRGGLTGYHLLFSQ